MSLPNFINFEPFNQLRKKMRAEELGRFGKPLTAPETAPRPPVVAGASATDSDGSAKDGPVKDKAT